MATTLLKEWPWNGFVVKDYTGIAPDAEPVVMVLAAADVFEFIADAATNKRQVAIFPIGPPVINWTGKKEL